MPPLKLGPAGYVFRGFAVQVDLSTEITRTADDGSKAVFRWDVTKASDTDRVKAAGLVLPLWAFTRLAEIQEPGGTGGEARSRREMGAVKNRTHFNSPRGYVGG